MVGRRERERKGVMSFVSDPKFWNITMFVPLPEGVPPLFEHKTLEHEAWVLGIELDPSEGQERLRERPADAFHAQRPSDPETKEFRVRGTVIRLTTRGALEEELRRRHPDGKGGRMRTFYEEMCGKGPQSYMN